MGERGQAVRPGTAEVTAVESAGARRERGPELLQTRFAERLRELLPAGQLVLSRPIHNRAAALPAGESAGRLTWVSAERSVEFETWVELTPSLAKLQTLPHSDLTRMPIPVLLTPNLPVRSCLRLERMGWSYFTSTGTVLIQHHDPLIAIRVITARHVLGDQRARPAQARRVADPRGQ